MSDKKYVSVLIIDAEKSATQALRVPAILLTKTKTLITSVVAVFAVLVLSIVGLLWYFIHTDMNAQESLALRNELTQLKNQQSQEVAEKLTVLNQSKESIVLLEEYLLKRGVKVTPTFENHENEPNPAAGGPIDDVSEAVFLEDKTSDQLESLFKAISQVPIGYPYQGVITSGYGNRSNPFTGSGGEAHGGLDFRGKIGDKVGVTAKGKVIFAGVQGGYGNLVQVQHGYGYSTYYGHLSKINVKVGDVVNAGDIIGLVGSTGRSTGPHLHYEVRLAGERQDPMQFLTLKS